MRRTTTAVLTVMALCGAAATSPAQDAAKTGVATAEGAEDAFLKAYFAERELKDFAAAEKAYAAVAEANPAAREVVARSLLGRARCLRELKRGAESEALFARVAAEFADVEDAAKEARAARRGTAGSEGESLTEQIRTTLERPDWLESAWKYGERGVPALSAFLRDDEPDLVHRAAVSLVRMEAPAAHEALAASIEARSSTYPDQVRNAAWSEYASYGALRRLVRTTDAGVRGYALSRLARTYRDAAAIEAVASDASLRTAFLRTSDEASGRVLVAALARGGEAREAALAALREQVTYNVALAFFDLPAPLLSDGDVLAPIARLVVGLGDVRPRPSPALAAAFLRLPQTAPAGVQLTLARGAPSDDPEAFVDAVARVGFGASLTTGQWRDEDLASALVAALGPRPSPGVLRRLAAAWPAKSVQEHDALRLSAFLDRLVASGVADDASLLAFQEGLTAQWQFHAAFIAALRKARAPSGPVGAWAAEAFLRELAVDTSLETHGAAVDALREWHSQFGDAAGLAHQVPRLIAAMGLGGSDRIAALLKDLGPAAVDALRAALPGHAHKAEVVDALANLGDRQSTGAIERVLAESADIEDENARNGRVEAAVRALAKLQGDAAKESIAAALVAHGGRNAATVLSTVREFEAPDAPFGARPRFELCLLAVEKCPGALSRSGSGDLPTDMVRQLAVAALRSPSVEDRRWGADREKDLLDAAAWDALLAAAEDADGEVRDTSRDALRAIRAKENELAEFRAMGEERETRRRIQALLASAGEEQRRAGVAAIAATGLPGMVNELIRLAAEDRSETIREDARRALLALAKPSAPSPQPSPETK